MDEKRETDNMLDTNRISVVTPTLRRPDEVSGLLENLSQQTYLPLEVILVDGAPRGETATEEVVAEMARSLPFHLNYLRDCGGTAIQRNVGIGAARGDFIAFVDDDIRLEPDFFHIMLKAFHEDTERQVGGIGGYITNQFLDPQKSPRWRWYQRLRLFTTYEPGRYDYETGYPINRYLQSPHSGIRQIDFMGSNCALWRREVFSNGLRFSEFFTDYGILEDAHFALRAKRDWRLLELGSAKCIHLKAVSGRENARKVARKSAVNYRYVFMDIVQQRTLKQEFRFWRVQFVDLLRMFLHAIRFGGKANWLSVRGKFEGIILAGRLTQAKVEASRG